MVFIKWIAVALLFIGAPQAAYADTTGSTYLLGPQDRLMIRVNSMRRNVGEAFPWPALTGEFSVGADGSLSLPMLGQVTAAGLTTAGLAEVIGRTLQRNANLADLPSASVEVVQYRPFFVLGAVQQPGKYDFMPGLTVLQAVSLAQGLARNEDFASAQRELVGAGGDVRLLGAERIALEVKLIRLKAQVASEPTLVFPDTLLKRDFDVRVTQAMQGEYLRFETLRNTLKSQLETVAQSKILLEQELVTLKAKSKSLDEQIESAAKELEVVNQLVAKGLAVNARQLAAEAAHAQIENNRLDVQLAILRAQQSLAKTERDLVDLPAEYRKNALDDLATTQSLFDANTEKLRTAEEQLDDAELHVAGTGSEDVEQRISYVLTRKDVDGPRARPVQENDSIEPGDVLQVKLLRKSSTEPPPASPAPLENESLNAISK